MGYDVEDLILAVALATVGSHGSNTSHEVSNNNHESGGQMNTMRVANIRTKPIDFSLTDQRQVTSNRNVRTVKTSTRIWLEAKKRTSTYFTKKS